MKKEFIALVSVASEKFKEIIKTAFTQTDNKTLHLCINAYNTYQENERNSVDYLFNAKDKNDVITCLNGGLTLQELYRIYGSKQAFKKEITSFFMFGCNHPTIKVMSPISLIGNLCAYSEEIVENMLLYPYSYNKEIYQILFSNNLVE
jgi:hypothetical protein